MTVLRRTKPRTPRPPRKRGSPADPLERLIDRAAQKSDDPAVKGWLRGLLRGERAGESK